MLKRTTRRLPALVRDTAPPQMIALFWLRSFPEAGAQVCALPRRSLLLRQGFFMARAHISGPSRDTARMVTAAARMVARDAASALPASGPFSMLFAGHSIIAVSTTRIGLAQRHSV